MHKGDVFGRYRLDRLLGSDYLGEIWVAFDTARRREVELRILPPEAAEDAEYLDRFWREAGITAQLQHPHIAPVHDYGMVDDRIFLATQAIAGRPLNEVLERDGAMDALRASRIVEQLASALDAANDAGLAGRAVDPATVLVAEHGGAFLTGVGLAVGPASRTDAQALTRVLVACLTGEPAADEAMPVEALPAALGAVIERGRTGDPQRGYRSAGALAVAMRAALGQRGQAPSGPIRTVVVERPLDEPAPAESVPAESVPAELVTAELVPVVPPEDSGSAGPAAPPRPAADTDTDLVDSPSSDARFVADDTPIVTAAVPTEPARASRISRVWGAARSASAARSAIGGRTDQHRGLVAALVLAVVVWVGAIVGVVIGNGPTFRSVSSEPVSAVPVNSQSPVPVVDRLPTVAAPSPGAPWPIAVPEPHATEVAAESSDPAPVEILPCYPGYTHTPEPAGPCLPITPAASAPGLVQVLPCYDGYTHTPAPDGPCLPEVPSEVAAEPVEPEPAPNSPPVRAGLVQQEVLPCYPGYVHTPSPDGPCLPTVPSVELTAQSAAPAEPVGSAEPALPPPAEVLPCYEGYAHVPAPDGPCLPINAGAAPVPSSSVVPPPSSSAPPSSSLVPTTPARTTASALPCFDGYAHTPPPDGPCLPIDPAEVAAPGSAASTSTSPLTTASDPAPESAYPSVGTEPATTVSVPVVLPCYPGYVHTPPPDGPCWAP